MNVALYMPDIPQNTGAIIRLGACMNLKIHIIEPCGFSLDDPRFKRVTMDYFEMCNISRYSNFDDFLKKNLKSRIILMTTKAKKIYYKFKFKKNDILLFGRESAGVKKEIHLNIKNRLKIPMANKARSMNVAMSVAIAASEAIKQTNQK